MLIPSHITIYISTFDLYTFPTFLSILNINSSRFYFYINKIKSLISYQWKTQSIKMSDKYLSVRFYSQQNYQRYLFQILMLQSYDLIQKCVNISRPYLNYFPRF